MSAASSLAALQEHGQGKRAVLHFDQLPDDFDILDFINENNQVLRFPEKLMLLMTYVETSCIERGEDPEKACISWNSDGRTLIIRDQDELTNRLLPNVFQIRGRFTSFTRKLYRWGFRQKLAKRAKKRMPLSSSGIKVFFHKFFQRDNKELLTNMTSIAAERTTIRRQTSPIVDRHQCHEESSEASMPSLTLPPQQATLRQLLSARLLVVPPLFQHGLQPSTEVVEVGSPSSDRMASSSIRFVAGQPAVVTAASPLLVMLARRQAMMAAFAPPRPSLPYVPATVELQNELARFLMKQSQLNAFVSGAWQTLPPSIAELQPTAASHVWHFSP